MPDEGVLAGFEAEILKDAVGGRFRAGPAGTGQESGVLGVRQTRPERDPGAMTPSALAPDLPRPSGRLLREIFRPNARRSPKG